MKRLKRLAGKGKEKVSSSTQGEDVPKRRRVGEEEEEEIEEDPTIHVIAPTWDSGPLSNCREEFQARFFIEKMNKLQTKKDGFVCEKEVPIREFKPWGIVDKFAALGWENTLKCYDGTKKMVYMQEIEEWVSTLKLTTGSTHNQTKLVGEVNGVKVTMSFATLNQIAKFDTKGNAANYWYPNVNDFYFKSDQNPIWTTMLQELFLPNTNLERLSREQLKLKPRLLHLIIQQNIIPRRGDRGEVRFCEVPVIYALMKGEPLMSFRYLVIHNIWLSRDSHERKMIPHCRLIAALLKKAGVITAETKGAPKRFMPFDIKHLGPNWEYGENDEFMRLSDANRERTWRVRKDNAGNDDGLEEDSNPAVDAEFDQSNSDDEERAHGPDSSLGPVGMMGDSSRPSNVGGRMSFEADWAYQGSTDDVVRNARPSSYGQWPNTTQLTFDHMTRLMASQERALKEMRDRQELWGRSLAYA